MKQNRQETTMNSKSRFHLRRAMTVLLGCLAASLATVSLAGDFSVAPIRMFLGKDRKSDVVTVKNNGTTPLQFEIRPKKWDQDADGKDVYSDTSELLVFPKLLTLQAGEDRDIRIGMKIPPGAVESTYRVFINELPPPLQSDNSNSGAANVGFLINFGLPVFFAPIKPAQQLQISSLSVANGKVSMRLTNSGNVFQFIQEMSVIGHDTSGAELFSEPITDRYLLAGTTKTYTTIIPADRCKALAVVELSVRTDKTSANANKNADEHSCASEQTETSPAETPR